MVRIACATLLLSLTLPHTSVRAETPPAIQVHAGARIDDARECCERIAFAQDFGPPATITIVRGPDPSARPASLPADPAVFAAAVARELHATCATPEQSAILTAPASDIRLDPSF